MIPSVRQNIPTDSAVRAESCPSLYISCDIRGSDRILHVEGLLVASSRYLIQFSLSRLLLTPVLVVLFTEGLIRKDPLSSFLLSDGSILV